MEWENLLTHFLGGAELGDGPVQHVEMVEEIYHCQNR